MGKFVSGQSATAAAEQHIVQQQQKNSTQGHITKDPD